MDQTATIPIDAAGTVETEPRGELKVRDEGTPFADTRSLVLRAQSGDRGAFDELMTLHERLVLRFAARVLRHSDDARDAAQEVFLKLYRNLSRIKSNADLRPWLYRVTINACHDLARRRGRFPSAELKDEIDQEKGLLIVSAGPEADIDHQEQRRIVREALRTLPFKERAAIVLRDIEGLSTEETAGVLRTAAGTVRSQIASGRLKIKRYCERLMGREQ